MSDSSAWLPSPSRDRLIACQERELSIGGKSGYLSSAQGEENVGECVELEGGGASSIRIVLTTYKTAGANRLRTPYPSSVNTISPEP